MYDQISTLDQICETRKLYGNVFVTIFPDNFTVPWHLLSLEKYLQFNRDYQRQLIPAVLIENEIFELCVVDDAIKRQLPFLNAGIITTVSLNIWHYSGPLKVSDFNRDFNIARNILSDKGTQALHDLVTIITMAFPYKPEEIYAMQYDIFLLRLAQAEKKLLQLNIISEPIEMKIPEEVQEVQKKPKFNVDPLKLWEQQKGYKKPKKQENSQVKKGKKWWNVSPVTEAKKKHNINFAAEKRKADEFNLDNDENASPQEVKDFIATKKLEPNRQKMINDAKWIYKDLLAELAAKKNI